MNRIWDLGTAIIAGILIGLPIYILSLALPIIKLRPSKAWFTPIHYSNIILNIQAITRSKLQRDKCCSLVSICVCYSFLFFVLRTDIITSLSTIEIVIISLFIGLITLIDIFYNIIYFHINLLFLIVNSCIGIRVNGIHPTIIGGLIGFFLFGLAYLLGKIFIWIINKYKDYDSNTEPLSLADFFLGTSLSILVGWPLSPFIFIFTFTFAAFMSLFKIGNDLLQSSYKPFSTYPLAPFINIGALLTILLPDTIRYLL